MELLLDLQLDLMSLTMKKLIYRHGSKRFSVIMPVKNSSLSFWSNILQFTILIIGRHYLKPIMKMPCSQLLRRAINITLVKKCKLTKIKHDIFTYIYSHSRLSSYWKVGRNLKHPKAVDLRLIALKRGKLSIVALLNDLPPSKHDLNSFAVDLTFFTVSISLFIYLYKC